MAALMALALGTAGVTALMLTSVAGYAEPRLVRLATPGTAQPVTFNAAAGSAVFFSTAEALVSTDTDIVVDVYRWDAGTLSLMTPESPQDVTFDAVSQDGSTVIYSADGVGGPGDNDGGRDIFWSQPTGNVVISQGAQNVDAVFKAASADASKVLFESAEEMYGDTDPAVDVFEGFRDPGIAQLLVSTGATADVHYAGAAADFNSIYFETASVLSADDHNLTTDVYAFGNVSSIGSTLVSNGIGGPDSFEGTSANAQVAYWSTEDDDILGLDVDGGKDIYRWAGVPQSKLVSGGNESSPVTFGAMSDNGSLVFFSTIDNLVGGVGGDTDFDPDVYRFDEGSFATDADDTLTLMSGGSLTDEGATFRDASADGSSVVFDTKQALPATGDTDTGVDIYRSTGSADGDKTLLSGVGPADVLWRGASATGARQFFTTTGSLAAADVDAAQDVYVHEGGSITLVSTGSTNTTASYAGNSPDGSYAWFRTSEQLVAADEDAVEDIYESRPGTNPPPPDTTPPGATTAAKTQKNDGTLELTLTCTEACTATPSGTLTVPTVAARGKKTFTLKGTSVTVAAGVKATLKLKVPKKAKKAAAAALKAGRKVTAKLTVVVVDAAGNKRTISTTLKLKK